MTELLDAPPADDYDGAPAPMADIGAERAVLGAMMLSADIAADVAEILTAASFWQPRHGIIFDDIVGALADSEPTDPAAIAARLNTSGNLTRIGGGVYLADLYADAPLAAQGTWHAGVVATHATRRAMLAAAVQAAQIAGDVGRDADEARDAIQRIVHEATTGAAKSTAVSIADTIDATLADVLDPKRADPGLSTGIRDLDRLIGGLRPGQLVIAAGRPGVGKSILAVDFARESAIRWHIPVLVCSLEMTTTEIQHRVLAAECEVNLSSIVRGRLTDREQGLLRAGVGPIREAPLHIDGTRNMTLANIRAAARRTAQIAGLGMIIVDYLQLVTPASPKASRVEQLEEISRGLKLLAGELDVPVVACAQLNRQSTQRNDPRPQLSDLRGSGSIEQDADVVILIHREDYANPEHPRAGEADLIVAKNRNGPQDDVAVAAHLHFTRFVDMGIDDPYSAENLSKGATS